MGQVIEGIIRGRTIELEDTPEVEDGQRVRVVIEPATDAPSPRDEGTLTPAPVSPELAALLDSIRRTRRPLPPSPTGPGRRSAAGMLADDPDFDAIMEEIQRQRERDVGRGPIG
jgi:hypothetical protein